MDPARRTADLGHRRVLREQPAPSVIRLGAVTLRACNGTGAQAWTLEPDGALSVGGKCLGLTGGATAPGTHVRLVACSGSADQVWQLAGGPIGVHVVSPVAGLCLADPGDRAVSGTQLVIGPCVTGDPASPGASASAPSAAA